jgi:Kef-type K+ transport system membrane component KefB
MDLINYWPLFIIFVIAWIVPLLLSWLEISKVPAVIVEIIMGVIIGPYVFDLVPEEEYIDFLASTGFLFLIFLAGFEINVNKILATFPAKKLKRIDFISNTLLLAALVYTTSLLVAFPLGWILNSFFDVDLVFFALLMPTVALSIIVPILKADGELQQKFGQVLLMEGAIATIMSIILISLYSGVLKHGFRFELLLFSVIFLVFIVTYIVARRLLRVRVFQRLLYRLEHAASQIRVRGTVALMLFFVIVANLINTELVMGAFFCGTLLSMFVTKERSALLFKLDGMSYGFFIPIFFIMVGVDLELSALASFRTSLPLIFGILLGFLITQVLPAIFMIKVFGFKKAMAGGILLSSRLGLSIAYGQIGLSLGVISRADNAGIVTAAILASLLSPVIYYLFNNKKEQYHQITILGGSRASLYLAERFRLHSITCRTIIRKKDIVPEFERKGIHFQFVDKIDQELLNTLNFRTGELVVVLTESKNLNLEITRYLKNKLNHSKIITRKQSAAHDLVEPDSDIKLVDNNEILASHVEDMIARPDAISSLAVSFDNYRLEEIHITNNSVHRKLVKDIAFPQTGSLVIHRRGGEIFIPHGNTHLLIGDVVTVIGNTSALNEFRKILER